jgi:hypothetical protein
LRAEAAVLPVLLVLEPMRAAKAAVLLEPMVLTRAQVMVGSLDQEVLAVRSQRTAQAELLDQRRRSLESMELSAPRAAPAVPQILDMPAAAVAEVGAAVAVAEPTVLPTMTAVAAEAQATTAAPVFPVFLRQLVVALAPRATARQLSNSRPR